MLTGIFAEISVVIVIAAVLAGIAKLLKQPIIVGYVLAGVILGPGLFNFFNHTDTLTAFSEIGISMLLFIVGLHLSPKQILEFGKTSVYVGLLQVVLTSMVGFCLAIVLKFSIMESLYIGAALSFSSTIIVLKFLSDKKDLERLYGRISVGILLLQDVVAAICLIFAATFSSNGGGFSTFGLLLLKGVALTFLLTICSVYILPKMADFFAQSQEFLFIFSVAWGLGATALFGILGFSSEMGALIAGVSLSVSLYSKEISSKLKPLRDFFVITFFILLGSRVALDSIDSLILPVLVLTAAALIVKPLVIMALCGLFGYNKKTGFLAGMGLSQLSEFSMVLVLLGVEMKHVSQNTLILVTLVGILSIAASTYMAIFSERIYPKVAKYLSIFEKKKPKKDLYTPGGYDVVLFGCNRAGYDFLLVFKDLGESFLAVDFDPNLIKKLKEQGVSCVYGDAEDSEFLDDINIGKAKIVVSTIPDFETNSTLLSKVRSKNENSTVIVTSYNIKEALRLYECGASYVVSPHLIGGEFVANLAKTIGLDLKKMKSEREKHISYLKERHSLGYVYPRFGTN